MTSRPHSHFRSLLAGVLTIGIGCGFLLAGGCASCTSREWAETAPAIAPSRIGRDLVRADDRDRLIAPLPESVPG